MAAMQLGKGGFPVRAGEHRDRQQGLVSHGTHLCIFSTYNGISFKDFFFL